LETLMDRLAFDDIELTYEVRGYGEPVMFVHASAFVGWYAPLIVRLAGLSVLHFRRRLRHDGTGTLRPLTIAEDAAISAKLMDHVGWRKAHILGHSYGALVALRLGMDDPDRVGALALLEPAARGVSSSEQAAAAARAAVAAYKRDDRETAMDLFLRSVCGDGYRAALDRAVPGAYDDAVREADVFFQAELPAVQQFGFTASDAQRVRQPVLNVRGAESLPRFVEASDLVQSWFPRAEQLLVPETGHLLMAENPTAVAQGLRFFLSRHPIDRTAVETPRARS
jgi:pimeloyl-ACP methyl ester carboxylesterase